MAAITGTVEPGRAREFDSEFRPSPRTRKRWLRVWTAEQTGPGLPPISVDPRGRRLRDPRRPSPRLGRPRPRRSDDRRDRRLSRAAAAQQHFGDALGIVPGGHVPAVAQDELARGRGDGARPRDEPVVFGPGERERAEMCSSPAKRFARMPALAAANPGACGVRADELERRVVRHSLRVRDRAAERGAAAALGAQQRREGRSQRTREPARGRAASAAAAAPRARQERSR